MSARAEEKVAGFRTAKEIYDGTGHPPVPVVRDARPVRYPVSENESLVVAPVIGLEEAKRNWNLILEFRDTILGDPECFDTIDGKKEMNRTGATRLALAFGLTLEAAEIEEGRVEAVDSGEWDYRYRARVRVSKAGRFADGIGSCRISEIDGEMALSKREHFALTRASTRAMKRAVADILGGTGAD